MKDFVEEYGFSILILVVIIALISMSMTIGYLERKQASSAVNNIAEKSSENVSNTSNNTFTVEAEKTSGGIEIKISQKRNISREYTVMYSIRHDGI